MKSYGMLAPDDLGLAPGQNQLGTGLVSQKQTKTTVSSASRLLVPHDRATLEAFLGRVLPVVETMLPVSSLRIAAPFSQASIADNNLSVCYTTLMSPSLSDDDGSPLAARDAYFHRTSNAVGDDRSRVAVAYGPADSLGGSSLDGGAGLVCVWDVNDCREPKEALRCTAAVTCCWMGHLSGVKATGSPVVVAGTDVGTIALWDLGQARDILGDGRGGASNGDLPAERWPTYGTDSHRAQGANHSAPVVCIRQCPNADESELAQAVAMSLQGSGHSFSQDHAGGADGSSAPVQIATMDTQGGVIIWSLIQLETEASEEMDGNADFGLAIGELSLTLVSAVLTSVGLTYAVRLAPALTGGKVKALKITNIPSLAVPRNPLEGRLTDNASTLDGCGLPCFDMQFCPHDSNQFLVATINGQVLRCVVHPTGPTAPRD